MPLPGSGEMVGYGDFGDSQLMNDIGRNVSITEDDAAFIREKTGIDLTAPMTETERDGVRRLEAIGGEVRSLKATLREMGRSHPRRNRVLDDIRLALDEADAVAKSVSRLTRG